MILYYDDKSGYCASTANTIRDLLAECRRDDETLIVSSDRTIQTDDGDLVRIISGTMCDCEYKLLEGTEQALAAYDPDSITAFD